MLAGLLYNMFGMRGMFLVVGLGLIAIALCYLLLYHSVLKRSQLHVMIWIKVAFQGRKAEWEKWRKAGRRQRKRSSARFFLVDQIVRKRQLRESKREKQVIDKIGNQKICCCFCCCWYFIGCTCMAMATPSQNIMMKHFTRDVHLCLKSGYIDKSLGIGERL